MNRKYRDIFTICLVAGLLFFCPSFSLQATPVPQAEQELEEVVHSPVKQQIVMIIRDYVPDEVTVFFISMIPIFELRGSIPVGIVGFSLHPFNVYILSIIGNIIPTFFILIFFRQVTRIAQHIPVLKRFLDWLFARTRKRSALIEKYEELGLMLFVAIPLPVTGAWTGSLAAYLLGLRFWKSIACIFIGVCTAGVIVTVLSLMGMKGLIIAIIVLSVLTVMKIIEIRKSAPEKETLPE